jgi:hypothetical protein
MGTKTLTITIENMPDETLQTLWDETIQSAEEELGFKPVQTDHIKLNFGMLIERNHEEVPEMLAELLSAALGVYSVQYFEDTYNK